MKIAIFATSFWPTPSPHHSGDFFYALLAETLAELGHQVSFFAPKGSVVKGCTLYEMGCSFGAYKEELFGVPEWECYSKYKDIVLEHDIIHDFSPAKSVAETMFSENRYNVISTNLGGRLLHPKKTINVCSLSKSQRDRLLRKANDYENTPMSYADTSIGNDVKDVHYVYLGIDTDFYTPTYNKKDYFLWFGRWHPVRNYKFAIELAQKTGIKLVMMGCHPDREANDYQRNCALEAVKLAEGCSSITFEWLPPDPNHHIVKRRFLREAKALIQPTLFQEPFGLGQAECLSCGTPIISTNYGSMPEIITSGKTGYTVDYNMDLFIEAIYKIDKIDIAECRKDAVSRFDRKIMATNYLKEYQLILEGKFWGI
jgi:glycosyltransferase involved in cell wall biosynthesis